MARFEQDREDLIREATALIDRCELVLARGVDETPVGSWDSEPWVVGVRVGGAVSLYLGAERVYHFNSAGQLRRAYVVGRMWKAEGGKLVGLDRRRGPERVELVRRVMTDEEQRAWLDEMAGWLDRLTADWRSGHRRVRREVLGPAGVVGTAGAAGGLFGWWLGWVSDRIGPIEVAGRPHVEGPSGGGAGPAGVRGNGSAVSDGRSVDRGQRGT